MIGNFPFAIADGTPTEVREGAVDRVRARFGLYAGRVEFVGHYPEHGYRLYRIVAHGEDLPVPQPKPEITVGEFRDAADGLLNKMLGKAGT